MINAADDIKDVGDARIFEFRAAVRDVEMFFLDDVVSYVRAIDERVAKAALAQTYLARSGLKESERGDLLDKWNGHERTRRRNIGSPNGPTGCRCSRRLASWLATCLASGQRGVSTVSSTGVFSPMIVTVAVRVVALY